MYTDLPVPVGPQKRIGLLFWMERSARKRYRTVSTVGTMICLNPISGGIGDLSMSFSHGTHSLLDTSHLKS